MLAKSSTQRELGKLCTMLPALERHVSLPLRYAAVRCMRQRPAQAAVFAFELMPKFMLTTNNSILSVKAADQKPT